jgi:hypothetical protein
LIVIVPVRALPVLVFVTAVTVPLPVPVAAETKEIQGTLADALHEQVLEACTAIEACLAVYPKLKPAVVR